MSTKRKPKPWPALAQVLFSEKKDPNGAEARALTRQIDHGYQTNQRSRAKTARHRERAVLLERASADSQFADQLMKGSLSKAFLNECGAFLLAKGFTGSYGAAWTPNTVRQLIKSMREPPAAPSRPFHDPNDYPDEPVADDPFPDM